MRPMLSVVIPTYNGEKYIGHALESLRVRASDELEIVVVDDGSSDRTLDVVKEFSALLPIQIVTPGRIGNWVTVSNLGLRKAAGDWACFLHQDDFWLEGRMERLRAEICGAKGVVVLHNAIFVGPNGHSRGPWTCPLPEGDVPPHQFMERLLIQNFIAMPSPVFRRAAVLDSGGLDESLWFAADWDLWLRLGAMGPVRFVPEILAAFRVHPLSQTVAREVSATEWQQQLSTVLTRHLQRWPCAKERGSLVERVAKTSIMVNSLLAAASRNQSAPVLTTLLQLLSLGPAGWHIYMRDSRIVQRVRSRLDVLRPSAA